MTGAERSGVLDRILAVKHLEIEQLRRRFSESALRQQAASQDAVRGFASRLRSSLGSGADAAIIAEVKKASPSRGVIRADFDPAWIAREYQSGGAACLSVLTDEQFFQGCNEFLIAARSACALPVIRKDFLIDPLQIIEARAIGADCVLLIAAALSVPQMKELADCAEALSMDVLVEVHNAAELDSVLTAKLLPRALLGINNRNLQSFETTLATTLKLLPLLPKDCEVVTESGIGTPVDVMLMRAAGVHRFLVGESLMRRASPGEALRDLLDHSKS